MRPAEQRRCTHASSSCTNTAAPHENKPRQSKQLVHAANASVVLNSAIASAVTPANPAEAVHTSCAPLSSAAAPTHHHRVQTPHGRTKTSRGRANSSCTRQKPRSRLIRQLPAATPANPAAAVCTSYAPPSSAAAPRHRYHVHAPKSRTEISRYTAKSSRARQKPRLFSNCRGVAERVSWSSCEQKHTPGRAALLHALVTLAYMHRNHARKQVAVEPKLARVASKSISCP